MDTMTGVEKCRLRGCGGLHGPTGCPECEAVDTLRVAIEAVAKAKEVLVGTVKAGYIAVHTMPSSSWRWDIVKACDDAEEEAMVALLKAEHVESEARDKLAEFR